MPLNTLKFNGESKPWLYLLEGRSKSPFAPVRNNLLRVQGMPGAYIESTDTDVLYITQPVGFLINNNEEAMRIKDELASWLLTDEPAPLEFSDESGRTYYAKIEGTIEDLTRLSKQRRGTLTFLCADPYSYGEEKTETFANDTVSINVEGTASTYPIIELDVLQPVTFAMVQNQNDDYMMIGQPINVEESTPFERFERIFYTDGTNLTGWTNGNFVDGGIVAGDMVSNGNRFQASSYGTGSRWHGPAKKYSLPEVLTDFRMEAFIGFFNQNVIGYVGRIEIYLLDANEQVVGKVTMKDTQSGQALAWAEARAGDTSNNYFLINEAGDNPGVWNNFSGITRLQREGNQWYAYFAMVNTNTGEHYARRSAYWTDTANKFTRTVSQVQIHIGQFGSHSPPASGIYSISVFKINQEADGTPYIAETGDKILFDHKKKLLLINGEPRNDLKDFGASFFMLEPGTNQLTTIPSNSFNATVKHQERWK